MMKVSCSEVLLFAVTALVSMSAVAGAPSTNVPAVLSYQSSVPVPTGDISAERTRARQLFIALTGLAVPIDDSRLVQMETYIKAGNTKQAMDVAIMDPSFYNIRIKNIAKIMSTRAESPQVSLNDFAMTFVGIAKDGADARNLLTQNSYYKDGANLRGVAYGFGTPGREHFTYFDTMRLSLYDALKGASPTSPLMIEGEAPYNTGGCKSDGACAKLIPVPAQQAAGVLTSQQFLGEHAVMGTNRRMVDYAFREFMCVSMADWQDATQPDDWVGRDVDRLAGGSNDHYQNTCRACHAQMDAFRGAFAYFDFTKYHEMENDAINNTGPYVAAKYARNPNTNIDNGYSKTQVGHVTVDDGFANYATGFLNADRFGWKVGGAMKGNGANAFATMLANSKGFSRCMTQRFFTAICKRAPASTETTNIRTMADSFETAGYDLRQLAEIVANNPICLPTGGQ